MRRNTDRKQSIFCIKNDLPGYIMCVFWSNFFSKHAFSFCWFIKVISIIYI